jgi:hypothetical protein
LAEHIFLSGICRLSQDREEPKGRGFNRRDPWPCLRGRAPWLGLKKLAIKLGGARFDSYAPEILLRGEEAEAYFQDLDQFCDEAFADRLPEERAQLAFGYVTWLVEGRALDVYGIYKKALGESEIAKRLGSLLAEETKRLADVEALLQAADTGFSTRSKEFEAVERSLYQTFIDALTKELSQSSQVAAVVAT